MPTTQFYNGRRTAATSVAFNLVRVYPLVGLPIPQSTASDVFAVMRVAGTWAKLDVYISANTCDAARTFSSRIGAAAGNQAISITASTTGHFSDTTNSDSVASGDSICYQLASGGTAGNITVLSITSQFTTTGNATNLVMGSTANLTSAGTSYFWFPGVAGNAVENNLRYKFLNSVTAKNFRVRASSNTFSGNATFTSRKNGADGNLTVTVPASTSGAFEDSSNTDSFASGDFIGFKRVLAAGSGTLALASHKLELESTTGISYIASVSSAGATFSTTATRYMQFFGSIEDNTAEPTEEATFAGTLSHLQCIVSANSTTSASTLSFRINGGNGTAALSVASGTTGHFEDTSGSESIAVNDDIGFRWTNGSAHNVTLNVFGAKYTESTGSSPVTRVFAWVCG